SDHQRGDHARSDERSPPRRRSVLDADDWRAGCPEHVSPNEVPVHLPTSPDLNLYAFEPSTKDVATAPAASPAQKPQKGCFGIRSEPAMAEADTVRFVSAMTTS